MKTCSLTEVITILLPEIPSWLKVDVIKSWVIGRSGAIPWIFIAMAFAANVPIQMGRYRSFGFSFKITMCWPVARCTRMLSTLTSTRSSVSASYRLRPATCPHVY